MMAVAEGIEMNQRSGNCPVEYGPLQESGMLSSGLDFYKPTMSQIAFEKHPEAVVTFSFKNRGKQELADYIDIPELQSRLDWLGQKGWTREELEFLASQFGTENEPLFSSDYLDYLSDRKLPPVKAELGENSELQVTTTGEWPMVTFWETVIMSEINELYFENYIRSQGLNLLEVYEEGDERLSEKVAILQANPDIKFADFGTRRRFSLRWQKHVVGRLINECPQNFIGSSNVNLARVFNTWPIGTFAHEMPMVYAGLADIDGRDLRLSHGEFLDDWSVRYGENLSTALTDTFTTDFFFEEFDKDRAQSWRALRQDSGDPISFGEKAIAFYEQKGIDPKTKTIVFSDGLDINEILKLYEHFQGRINVVFGWGTTLTNDLGIPALNIVMKATHLKVEGEGEVDLVKLSDDEGKHTGPAELVERYQNVFRS